MPTAEKSGFVPTLNKMGYMMSSLDKYTSAYIDFAAHSSLPVLEIGAAYGVVTLPTLARGAKVIANDIESRHLEILKERAGDLGSKLSLLPGDFPSGIQLAESSIGAVLVARVLHFFDGAKIEEAANTIYRWLAPGGKAFITAETPYLKNWSAAIPIYEARKKAGHPWPGFHDNVAEIVPERAHNLQPQMHHLDPEVLTRVFTNAGFIIEEAKMFARPEFPEDLQLDGRESVGLIARKP